MKTFAIATFLSALGVASAIPGVSPAKLAARDPSDDPRGSYTISGLGTRKQQVTAAGANTLGLAVAMLETDTMSSDYTYGDGKTEDSANFGIFKQNWGMLRVCCSQFQGQSQDSWNNGAALNSNLNADVSCLNQCQSYYGISTWFGGQRYGSTGLSDPSLYVVVDYEDAIYWIQGQIEADSTGTTDDTRFWVEVEAI